ncbi:hypothetical protein ACFLUF_00825 [Chloroflexota bacterium]
MSTTPTDTTAFRPDPTVFRPMKVTASRETSIGFEVEPATFKLTLDKMRLYLDWPETKNRHTDYAAAQQEGKPAPFAMFNHLSQIVGSMLVKFFGTGYLGGTFSGKAVKICYVDDVLTTRMIVTDKVVEGDKMRIILDVWIEDQNGEKIIVGNASGMVT